MTPTDGSRGLIPSPSPIKVGLRDWRGLLVGCCFIVLVWAMLGVTE